MTKKEKQEYLWGRIIRYSLVSTLLVLAIFAVTSQLMYDHEYTAIKGTQEKNIEINQFILENFLNDAILDLKTISEMDLFINYIEQHKESQPLQNYMSDLSIKIVSNKLIYNQLRFINIQGMEVFRIDNKNSTPRIVTQSELQNKSNRYYFNETMKLNKGQFYLSPFDLNIENEEIEIPHRPVIRISTPVFDTKNQKIGMVIINFNGTELFQKLDEEKLLGNSYSYFTNKDGYFLKAPNHEIEWGFMFPSKKNTTISEVFSSDYSEIEKTSEGQIKTADGLYTISTANPLSTIKKKNVLSVFPENNYWKIILFIPQKELSIFKILPIAYLLWALLVSMAIGILTSYYISLISLKKHIAQQELILSEQQLKKSNQTKDQFFSILSHDLKNSAGTILMFLEYINEDFDKQTNSEIKEYIGDVRIATLQHHKLLNEILNWARLQLDHKIINPISISVSDLFNNQSKNAQMALEAKGLQLEIKLDEYTIIYADWDMISAILRNLINNAIKFSYRENKIQLIGKRLNETVELSVVDYGVGISEKNSAKLFDLLSSFQQKGTENEAGSGFGLKLVAEMVNKNNGTIKVESSPQTGTHFIVTLPAH